MILILLAPSVRAAPAAFNVDGVIHKPDGSALEESSVQISIEVRSPSAAGNCLLYREDQTIDMTGSNGYFSVPLGSHTNVAGGGYSLETVLGLQAMTGLDDCASHAYTPTAADARQLRILFTENGVTHDFGVQAMNATPFAVTAKNLEGKAASEFIQTGPAITQARVESVFGRYPTLDAILNGTFAGNATTATALAAAPGACSAGQYMTAMTASGAITCGTPATGSVTNVTSANAYLSVATGTSTPVLTLNVGSIAGSVAAGNDARFSDSRAPNGAASGDLSGTYPNPTVAKISGKTVTLTSPAAGDLLTYDGSKFVNSPPATAADATKLPLAGGTMSGGIDMSSQNLTNLGFVTMSANKSLHLSNNAADPSGLGTGDKGKMWFNSTTGEVKFWNGSAAQPLGVAGSGLQTFNTQTGTSQTLAIGTSGTAPVWSSASNVHTLNIPLASGASVTAGLISKTDYDSFAGKLDASSTFAGDVTGTPGTTSVDKIKGKAVAPAGYASGQVLRYDGTQWVNAVLGFSDLGSKPTTLAGYGITDAQSSTLADGKIFVGNASNAAIAVTMSGDATMSNSGVVSLATVPVSKGGTGLTSLTGDKLMTTSAAGAVQTTSCALNQVISFTAGGAITCANVSSLAGTFLNNGNSFSGEATLGTNDDFSLNFETNNATKMTITSDGKVGIGTTAPTANFQIFPQSPITGSALYAINASGGTGGTGNGNGGGFMFNGGAGNGSGTGGGFTWTGGASSTGSGGALVLTSGAGNGATGGKIAIDSSNANAGNITIQPGMGNSSSSSGTLNLIGGQGPTSGPGAPVNLTGGSASSTTFPGGSVNIAGGSANGSTVTGGDVNITGGFATGTTVNGGAVNITGGGASGTIGNGANVNILGGPKGASGSDGNVILANGRGRVGIGTASPTTLLHVENLGGLSSAYFAGAGGAVAPTILVKNTNAAGIAGSFSNDTGTAASFRGQTMFVQTHASTAAITVGDTVSTLLKVQKSAGAIDVGWNSADAIMYVAKDGTSGRSINAAGTINATGADFAEWVEWAGAKPPMGSVVKYRGAYVVVSSPFKAAFIGNDLQSQEQGLLIAFAGQLPVLIEGEVHEGDLIVGQPGGVARAVPKELASIEESRNAVGTAWESSHERGIKRINVAVGIGLSGGIAEFRQLEAKIADKENDIATLKRENEAMKHRLEKIEKLLGTH